MRVKILLSSTCKCPSVLSMLQANSETVLSSRLTAMFSSKPSLSRLDMVIIYLSWAPTAVASLPSSEFSAVSGPYTAVPSTSPLSTPSSTSPSAPISPAVPFVSRSSTPTPYARCAPGVPRMPNSSLSSRRLALSTSSNYTTRVGMPKPSGGTFFPAVSNSASPWLASSTTAPATPSSTSAPAASPSTPRKSCTTTPRPSASPS